MLASFTMRAVVIVLVIVVLAMVACGDSGKERLESARRQWNEAAVADYSFRYRTTGFPPQLDVRVTVRSGTVTVVERVTGTFDLSTETAPTIESLFDEVARALDGGEVDVSASYDPALGYPASAYFSGGSDGSGFEVNELVTSG
jgi:uncharacterized protein with FMN-binding domain